jgi:ribosomal protein S18 acetylase RimI-like enzyme
MLVIFFDHDIMIALATETDIPRLNRLINSAYRGESSKKGWTTEADLLGGIRTDDQALRDIIHDPQSFLLKYVLDGEIVGCVHLRKDDDELYLGMLTVSPDLQAKGIGKQLLLAAEDEARKRNCRAIYMTVISARKELIAWYQRHGYVDTGERKPFRGEGIPKTHLEFVVLRKEFA